MRLDRYFNLRNQAGRVLYTFYKQFKKDRQILTTTIKILDLNKNFDYLNDTLKLIEKNFDYPANHAFQVDFYPLFTNCSNNINYILLSTKGAVIGHIGAIKKIFSYKNEKILVLLIGGIVIDKEFQGKGLLNNLFEKLFSDELAKDISLALLWSNKTKLYEKFGFYESGEIIQTNNQTFYQNFVHFKKCKLKDLSTKEIYELKKIYDHHHDSYMTIERQISDWECLKHITSADFFIQKNEHGIIDKYFVINKGADLKDIIHEFACAPSKKTELINLLKTSMLWLPKDLNNYKLLDQDTVEKSSILFTAFFKNFSNKDMSSLPFYISGLDSV